MMGVKERSIALLVNGSLEDLAQPDHFYRHVEHTLHLSIERELVSKVKNLGILLMLD